MGRRRKSPVAWLLLLAIALLVPLQDYLSTQGYENIDQFFEDLLIGVVLLTIIIVPLLLIYLLFFKKSKEPENDEDDVSK